MSTLPPHTPPETNAPAVVTDEDLVARARTKDFAAFEELVDRYEDKIFRLAFRFVRNETEAKEIVQDTFLLVWRKLDTFKGDSQFGSWLYRVATNTALMRLRAQRRHPEISTEELPVDYLDNYGQLPAAGENWAKRPDDELQSDELRRADSEGGRRAARDLPDGVPHPRRRGALDRGDGRGARDLHPDREDPAPPRAAGPARRDHPLLRPEVRRREVKVPIFRL